MPSSAFQTCALDRKSTRLNSSHTIISYAVFCFKKKEIADSPVVLEVGRERFPRDVSRRVTVAHRDQRNRPVDVVGDVGFLDRAPAGDEGDVPARLVVEL